MRRDDMRAFEIDVACTVRAYAQITVLAVDEDAALAAALALNEEEICEHPTRTPWNVFDWSARDDIEVLEECVIEVTR